MKKCLLLTLLAVFFAGASPVVLSASNIVPPTEMNAGFHAKNESDATAQVKEKKRSLKERFALRKVKKLMNKGHQELEGMVAAASSASLLAFILGFILSWIGVLIVLLIGGDLRAAVIGALISLLLWVAIVVL